ncbi:cell wall hydrolase [Erythrobacter sp. SDW2]|uniref:cell wall hydrolase n=1 Tax=Erythrobacter sp. SDW2 TaxID=2907154 RepID=UPI001F2DD8B0|nr:cell wall hydrolase [Erythrobacter sp. SDW2]UIP06032.1 cell wall hydrolase [Erythrobacter sp. SDW2]
MSTDHPLRRHVRENAPLLGVVAVMIAAFIGLAALSPGEPTGTGKDASGPAIGKNGTMTSGLDGLPAAANDTVVLSELAPDDARARNALVDFAKVGPGAPRPFQFRGTAADRIRARDCLALAGMAEAGSGDGDQRAVMQVILNRVRHPAFAKTVCGVVFEGSQRATGCQFSFTCDGSLARRYADASWAAARKRAEEMLGGATYAPVGNATHFHADYVYPWWSPQLDKVAQVGAHIFFRWRGHWGTTAALSASYAGTEPDPMALRQTAIDVAEANPLPTLPATPTLLESGEAVRTITATGASDVNGAAVASGSPGSPAAGVHFVIVSGSESPEALVAKARMLCPGDRYCQVYGWSDAGDIPAKLPLPAASRQTLKFSFLPARGGSGEAVYFDCQLFPAPAIGSCLPRARP